jgi:hypothetical protein
VSLKPDFVYDFGFTGHVMSNAKSLPAFQQTMQFLFSGLISLGGILKNPYADMTLNGTWCLHAWLILQP